MGRRDGLLNIKQRPITGIMLPYTEANEYIRDMAKGLYITYYKGGMDEQLKLINQLEQELEKKQELENAIGTDGL